MIGDSIKHYRKASGLKQKELGKIIGVANTTISTWENNITEPSIDMIEKLCGALKVSPNELLSSNPKNQENPSESEGLQGVYFSLAKDMQDNKIHPDDIKTMIELLKRNRNENND